MNQSTENRERSGLRNRVDPRGQLHDTPEHGSWLGNRGILHNDQKQIIRQWQHTGWVTCLLKCGESTRTGETTRDKLFTEGNYSELFFLDEATAFSAGHRPCAQCRNKRYKEFKSAWIDANSHLDLPENLSSKDIDNKLQEQRVVSDGGKRTDEATLESLPAGSMIDLDSAVFLIWRGRLYRWSFSGYLPYDKKIAPSTVVKVLTPASIVRMFASGFVPHVHVSAFW